MSKKDENQPDPDFDLDERLFHYTSSQGLFGILESECFWATHFKFLNDSNEFFAAKKSLTQFVSREIRRKIAALKVSSLISLKDGTSIDDVSKHEAQSIVESMYFATLDQSDPYIFSSFASSPSSRSFRNGELLHWATYGRNGGYAIEINPHKLTALLTDDAYAGWLSRKAVYVDDEAPPELANDFAVIGAVAQQMIVGILSNNLEGVDIAKSAAPFTRIASVIKDGYFRSEKESRLVAMRFKGRSNSPSVFIRHTEIGAVPYIKLFEKKLFGSQCPIEAIIIGPHPDRKRRKEALSISLESRGLQNIEVIQSEVPYIGG